MAVKLKPCPFCGGKARTEFGHYVKCTKCGGMSLYCSSLEKSIVRWNRRVSAPVERPPRKQPKDYSAADVSGV